MIALHTRRLASAAPLYYEAVDPSSCKVHRQAQPHRPGTDNQYFSLAGDSHDRFVIPREFASIHFRERCDRIQFVGVT